MRKPTDSLPFEGGKQYNYVFLQLVNQSIMLEFPCSTTIQHAHTRRMEDRFGRVLRQATDCSLQYTNIFHHVFFPEKRPREKSPN